VVICLERGSDLHVAKLMSLPLTVSCFSKIQIVFTFLVPAQPGSPGKGLLNGCVCLVSILLALRMWQQLSLFFTGFEASVVFNLALLP